MDLFGYTKQFGQADHCKVDISWYMYSLLYQHIGTMNGLLALLADVSIRT